MRKKVPFGRHIAPEVKLDPVLFFRAELPERYFVCERKIKYKSIKSAGMAIRRIKKTGKIVENANIYNCEFCNKFHLGHKKKPT